MKKRILAVLLAISCLVFVGCSPKNVGNGNGNVDGDGDDNGNNPPPAIVNECAEYQKDVNAVLNQAGLNFGLAENNPAKISNSNNATKNALNSLPVINLADEKALLDKMMSIAAIDPQFKMTDEYFAERNMEKLALENFFTMPLLISGLVSDNFGETSQLYGKNVLVYDTMGQLIKNSARNYSFLVSVKSEINIMLTNTICNDNTYAAQQINYFKKSRYDDKYCSITLNSVQKGEYLFWLTYDFLPLEFGKTTTSFDNVKSIYLCALNLKTQNGAFYQWSPYYNDKPPATLSLDIQTVLLDLLNQTKASFNPTLFDGIIESTKTADYTVTEEQYYAAEEKYAITEI